MRLSKTLAAVAAVTCITLGGLVGGLVASAQTPTAKPSAAKPKPEIDRANATLGLQGPLTSTECAGEDGISYVTYSGTWQGAENQILPDATDYPLSGSLTVSGIHWTINLSTQRGVWTSKAVLTDAAGQVVYSGKLTLVTQGLPNSTAAPAMGRGWIYAPIQLPDEGVTPGDDSLIANVEFPNLTQAGGSGYFGDLGGPLAVPDYSVVQNVYPSANNQYCGAP